MLKDLTMIINETGLYFLKLSMFVCLGSIVIFLMLYSKSGEKIINKFM